MPQKYLVVPVDTQHLLDKLSPLQPPQNFAGVAEDTGDSPNIQSHFKAVTDWFRLLFLQVASGNASKCPVRRQGLKWEFCGKSDRKYTFPSRLQKANKEKPYAIDCLALGRLLHAVQEHAEADFLEVFHSLFVPFAACVPQCICKTCHEICRSVPSSTRQIIFCGVGLWKCLKLMIKALTVVQPKQRRTRASWTNKR